MRILITGHQGFIGGRAVNYFKDQHDIVTYDWTPGSWPDLRGVDCVMHFGAISSTNERDVEKVLEQNLDFSVWLYHEACREGALFQYSSSASVYGSTTHFSEDGPVDPQSPYAWSKYLLERHIRDNACEGIHAQGFRYFNVYGGGEELKLQPSPYQSFFDQAETQGAIILYVGEREARRDFVPVERVLDVHRRFLSIPESGVWNIGTGETTTFRQIAELVSRQTGAPIIERPLPNDLAGQYQWYTCADLTRLNSTLERYS